MPTASSCSGPPSGKAQPVEHAARRRDPARRGLAEAYRAFGAKPQRTRNSLEAQLRRVDAGLPQVNRLTGVYNVISVRYLIPFRGEDLDHHSGAPPAPINRHETFTTTASGTETLGRPDQGEAVWCDDYGVTCRRWNWRQTTRTQPRDHTTAALSIPDALAPVTEDDLQAAGDDLITHLTTTNPALASAQRLVSVASNQRP